jgi:hypothetical protein
MPSDTTVPTRSGWRSRLTLPLAVAIVGGVSSPAAADMIERRGSAQALEGRITGVDDNGVTLRSPLGAIHIVPWDRVRDLKGIDTDPTLAQRMKTALSLWRARSRVERGDTTLAEPLLERRFEEFRGRTHETALVVAEGLLRCRIARGDHVLSVIPALEVGRLRRAGIDTASYSMLPRIFDTEYAVCEQLAPVWLPTPQLASLAHDLETYDARDDEVIEALRAYYHRAALRVLARRTGDAPKRTVEQPGVVLLERLDACIGADADRRNGSREQLRRAIVSMPPWAEAWARYQIGVSLLMESGLVYTQEGAVSLAHLPARFSRTQPYLTGLALQRIAETVEGLGDVEAAERLRFELQRSLPRHPLHTNGNRVPKTTVRTGEDQAP